MFKAIELSLSAIFLKETIEFTQLKIRKALEFQSFSERHSIERRTERELNMS